MKKSLHLADGRTVEFRVTGPIDGLPLVFHHGTPGTLPTRRLESAALSRGLRLVTSTRPGYGGSTRQPGRTVIDVVSDTAAVLGTINAARSLLLGWSGGGPHALACAARLPSALGVATIASLASPDAAGLDFTAGMCRENRHEWNAAFQGEAALRALIEPLVPSLTHLSTHDDAIGSDELPDADVAALTSDLALDLGRANREALQHGVDGWVDDELAFVRPLGFDVPDVRISATSWHGTADLNVPFSHGRWLASHVPNASFRPAENEGHFSIMTGLLEAELDGLTAH